MHNLALGGVKFHLIVGTPSRNSVEVILQNVTVAFTSNSSIQNSVISILRKRRFYMAR